MIITNNETALRIVCRPVTMDEVGSLIETLEKELEYANRLGRGGVGLAAPQIGLAKDIAIVRLPKMNFNLVNAKLKESFDPSLFRDEGCLSFPGRVENTMRFQEVHMINNLVEPHNFIVTGFASVVVQHEIDHLNSTLFFDRMAPPQMPVVKKANVGPNDLCPCGSKRKYKRCCK